MWGLGMTEGETSGNLRGLCQRRLVQRGGMRGGRKEGKILEAPHQPGPGGAPPSSALWLPCILKDFLVPSLLFAEMGEPLCDPSP